MLFSDRFNSFEDEIFASLDEKKLELLKQGRHIYNLSIGTPDFKVSDHIKNALIEAAKDPDSWKYALRDLPELTKAVVDYYKNRFGVTIDGSCVASCNGSQEGMGSIALTLCNKGDTVLLPAPCYPVFINAAKLAEADIHFYEMKKENGFLPDVASIPEDIARKAKYMIVSLPSNPMGSVGTPKVYREIIGFAKKYDVLIIHDNAYSDIIYDGQTGGSFFSYEGASEIGVEFFSLSKSFDVTGARISFLVGGRKDVVDAFRKLRSQTDFGMFIPIQKAAVAALTGPLDGVKRQCALYESRRNILCGGLKDLGWDVNYSKGSMFVWCRIPDGYKDSMSFCLSLMEKTGVICTPGSSFGPVGEGYVRFALVLPDEELKKAVAAMKEM